MEDELRFYLAQEIHDAIEPHRSLLAIFLGAPWTSLLGHYALFPQSAAVFYVTAFWVMSWILGFTLAWAKKEVSTKKAARSIGRWLLWMFALSVAWGFRDAKVMGGEFISGAIETLIMLTEGLRVFRLLAFWADHLGFKGADKLLSFFANTVENRIVEVEGKLSHVEVQQTVNVADIQHNKEELKLHTEVITEVIKEITTQKHQEQEQTNEGEY